MTTSTHDERRDQAQEYVQQLLDKGYTMSQISIALNRRVSKRTLQRWKAGDSGPKNEVTFELLKTFAANAQGPQSDEDDDEVEDNTKT